MVSKDRYQITLTTAAGLEQASDPTGFFVKFAICQITIYMLDRNSIQILFCYLTKHFMHKHRCYCSPGARTESKPICLQCRTGFPVMDWVVRITICTLRSLRPIQDLARKRRPLPPPQNL